MRVPLAGLDWPLVGRAPELAAIRSALRGSRAGVLLVGRPGVGRSRLLREATTGLAGREYLVECLPTGTGAGPPLAAFAHLLDGVRTTDDPIESSAAVVRALTARARGRRVVLGIDDAHLLDNLSAAIVAQLVAHPKFVVVATMRTGEPAPDAMTALWKDEVVERFDLAPLTEIEVEELIRSVLDGPPSTMTTHLLWELTGGNVLLLRELVRAGLESSALRRTDGMWIWHGPLVVDDRLEDVVRLSIGVVDHVEQHVLDVLAHGEQLDVLVVESLFSIGTLRAVEARGLLACVPGRASGAISLRLFPPLLAQVIRARTQLLDARAVRRKISRALPATGTAGGDEPDIVLRRTRLRLDAGGVDDPAMLARAAGTALAEFDYGFAERSARLAHERGGGEGSALLLAEALHRLGRSHEAIDVLEALDAGTPEGGSPENGSFDETAHSRATALRAEVLGWGLGRADDARALLADGAAMTGSRPPGNLLDSLRAAMNLSCGRLDAALDGAETVMDSAAVSSPARLRAASTSIAALALTGRSARALAEVERWSVLGPEETVAVAAGPVMHLTTARCLALYAGGRLHEAARESELRYRAALACGDERAGACFAVLLGRITLDRGLLPTAHRWLTEAALLTGGAPRPDVLVSCQSWLAELAALRGDSDRAAEHVARAEEHSTPVTGLARTYLMLARSWLAASRPDLAEARRLAAAAAETALRGGNLHAGAVAWHTVARLGDARRAAPHLQRLACSVDGGQVDVYSAHAHAIVGADGAALDTVAMDLDRLGAQLLAAEAAAEASVAYRANGSSRLGRAAAATARAHVESCGGDARSPALLSLATPALTAREREIALLAARGLSSRTIAARLTLSVRTVDNHLQVTYGKLSIGGRRELPGALDSTS